MSLLPTNRREVAVAVRAVERGLDLAMSRIGADSVRSKGGRDIVTATDVAIEQELRSILGAETSYPVIGEEQGGRANPGTPYWLVDPICGTRNYASGIPLFAVNVAMVDDRKIVLSAVGDGSTGEISVAESGVGAFMKGTGGWHKLRSSPESKIVAVDGWPAERVMRRRAGELASDVVAANKWDVRSLSTTLALAYLASGRIAGYVLFSTPALHTAAGVGLAVEAGAKVTRIDGRPWTVSSSTLIAAADRRIYGEIYEMVTSALGRQSR
jgi:myo-inositol-1(or 4)-monophosphatase